MRNNLLGHIPKAKKFQNFYSPASALFTDPLLAVAFASSKKPKGPSTLFAPAALGGLSIRVVAKQFLQAPNRRNAL